MSVSAAVAAESPLELPFPDGARLGYVADGRDAASDPSWLDEGARLLLPALAAAAGAGAGAGAGTGAGGSGHWWLPRIHPDDRQHALAFRRAVLSGEPAEAEYRFRAGEGSYRLIRDAARLAPLDGAAVIVGEWTDVTGRRRFAGRSDAALPSLVPDEETTVRRATEALALEAANVIAAVTAGWELLAGGAMEPQARRDFESLQRMSARALGLVRQAAALNRTQGERLEERSLASLAAELEHVVGGLMPRGTSLALTVRQPSAVVRAEMEGLRCALVLLALHQAAPLARGVQLEIVADVEPLTSPVPHADGLVPAGRWARIAIVRHAAGAAERERTASPTPPEVVFGMLRRSGGHVVIDRDGVGMRVYLPLTGEGSAA